MTSKNIYSDLFIANGVAETAAADTRKELHEFVNSRFQALHKVGRRVLQKEFGFERFAQLTAKDTGDSLAWLLERYLKISKLTENSVTFTNAHIVGERGAREYTLRLDEIFGLSDWDFAFKVRQTVRHVAAAHEEQDVINAERTLRAAQIALDAAKATFDAAEADKERKRLKAEGARDRQTDHLVAINDARTKRRENQKAASATN